MRNRKEVNSLKAKRGLKNFLFGGQVLPAGRYRVPAISNPDRRAEREAVAASPFKTKKAYLKWKKKERRRKKEVAQN